MQKNSGFSLIEMMVVIAIIAIVASIAVPNFIGWLPKQRLGTASRDILSALHQARLRAVKENADVTVQFDIGNDSYIAFLDNGEGGGNPADGVQNGSEIAFKSTAMPAGIDLNNTTFSNNRISFSRRGLPNNVTGGTVTIRNSENVKRQIGVNQTGNSRIVTP
jgi:type IV fimbrial biogenesis protein FimT